MDGQGQPVGYEVLHRQHTRVNVHVHQSGGGGYPLAYVGLRVEHDGEEGVEGELARPHLREAKGALQIPGKEGRVVLGDGEAPQGDLVATLEGGVLPTSGNHLPFDDRSQR